MVAIGLLFGDLRAEHYEDQVAQDSRIDALRAKMRVQEDSQFTMGYYDPEKRAIGNSVQVFWQDGTATDKISVEYPIGHRRRRQEGLPLLMKKFEEAVAEVFPPDAARDLLALCEDRDRLLSTPVPNLMTLLRGGQ